MEHKKFHDIPHVKENLVSHIGRYDQIWVEEKIDGANIGLRYDPSTDMLVGQSRKRFVDEKEDLRGFYGFVQSLNANAAFKENFKTLVGPDKVLFGEWLVKHSVPYPEDKYNKAYFYDVFDLATGGYMYQAAAYEIFKQLNLLTAPVFYIGEFQSWDFVKQWVGKTMLGGEYGEGIVIKNQTALNADKTEYYIKIVCDQFKETSHHKVKIVDPKKMAATEKELELAKTIVTFPRVDKILHKLVDEGVLPPDWGSESMGVIAKNLTKRVVEDCIKEEKETVDQIPNFGKVANKISMALAKDVLWAKE